MRSTSLYTILFSIPSAISSSIPLYPRSPSTTNPTCYYDYTCPIYCHSSPRIENCQQSIDAVCAKVATASPSPKGKQQWFHYDTKTPTTTPLNPAGDAGTPSNDDCMALVRVSASTTLFPSAESCVRTFESLQGCAASTNQNFNASCVGGSINVDFCSDRHGLLLDDKAGPAFALGTADELHILAPTHFLGDADKGEAEEGEIEETLDLGPFTQRKWECLTDVVKGPCQDIP